MRSSSFALALVTILCTTSAHAAAEDDATCARMQNSEAPAACSRLIASGRKTGSSLAVIYSRRCAAKAYNNDPDSAMEDCNQAVSINPKLFAAHSNRCWVWNLKKDSDRAITDCDEAIRLNPKHAASYNQRGLAWRMKGDFDRAIADFDEAIRLRPRYAAAFSNRCAAWNHLGKPDRSIADCNQAIGLNSKLTSAYDNRCWARNLKREFDSALADCNEAILLNPGRAVYFNHRGNAWRGKGEPERAIADYSEALRLEPKFIYPYGNRGLIHEAMGRLDQALADFQAIVALNPNYPLAKERVARVEEKIVSGVVIMPRSGQRQPETRVALIIGNDAYLNVGALNNARRDAELLAATFRRIGFTAVVLNRDLPRDKFIEALKSFTIQADRADWAVVYYAGHGMEFAGDNYLIPTDARLASDRDIAFEAVALNQVLLAVEGARKLSLVILDACRDNPFLKSMKRSVATRSIGRGLAGIEPDGATLVAYSAKAGQVASDGEDGNSPFVTSFARHLDAPALEINLLFRKVRDDVLKATNRRQEPFVYGSLPAEAFYFRPP